MHSTLLFKKRPATTGISGHLYETKLLSLILHRAIHDDDVEEFCLGTNVDGLGVFDDICFRAKLRHSPRPLVVLLQAKHRDDKNKSFTTTTEDLEQFYDSYLKITNKFHVNSTDALFRGKISDVDCVVVFYTTMKSNIAQIHLEAPYVDTLNSLIKTGKEPLISNQIPMLREIIIRKSFKQLAEAMAVYILSDQKNAGMFMAQEIIKIYHVVVARLVFDFGEVQGGHRVGTFRKDFLWTEDPYLLLLKEHIFLELLLKHYKVKNRMDLSKLISDPNAETLSEYLGKAVLYNEQSGKLNFVKSYKFQLKEQEELLNLNVTASTVREAIQLAGLRLFEDKVIEFPVAFGNFDLNLKDDNIDSRLDYLKAKIIDCLEKSVGDVQSEDKLIVDLDEIIKDRSVLEVKGGLGSAVGNLFVLDEETKLLKFGDSKNLPTYAKTLWDKIYNTREIKNKGRRRNLIPTLDRFRFRVNAKRFPKIDIFAFEHETNLAEDFLKKLVFYTNQANQETVELELKEKLKFVLNSETKTNAAFALYHNKIMKWWMEQGQSSYVTKDCDWFQRVLESIKDKSYVYVFNLSNDIDMQNLHTQPDEILTRKLDLHDSDPKVAILTTESIKLSVSKIIQACKDYSLVDLDYVTSLPLKEYEQINLELSNVHREKTFILTSEGKSQTNVRIKHTIKILESGKVVVVTYKEIADDIKSSFSHVDMEVHDDNNNFESLQAELQATILENSKVIFQGLELNLNSLVDDASKKFISGEQLRKVLQYENISIGRAFTDSTYEEIKRFYISRSITKKDLPGGMNSEIEEIHGMPIKVNNVYDVEDCNVAITAPPGLGKSCLLSHVAVNTKAHDPTLWVVRLNLFDYSKYFREWRENVNEVSLLEALVFICKTFVSEEDGKGVGLRIVNDEIQPNDGVKPKILFELRMFLHFYNKRRVVFLIDGYDEICSRYEKEVNQFLKAFRPHEQPFWITTRKLPCNLKVDFVHYELNNMSRTDQIMFLETVLDQQLDLNDRNQRKKINYFFSFVKSRNIDEEIVAASCEFKTVLLHEIYIHIALYLQKQVCRIFNHDVDEDTNLKTWNVDVSASNLDRLAQEVKTKMLNPTPLYMFMAVDSFQNDIKSIKDEIEWMYNSSVVSLYHRFVRMNLEKSKSDNRFIEAHKKLAAYTVFFLHQNKIFNDDEIDEIKALLKAIMREGGPFGLITGIIEGVPRFVHSSIADYLAVEYICEGLTAPESIMSVDFIVNTIFSYDDSLPIFNDKLVLDTELERYMRNHDVKRSIFELLISSSRRRSSTSKTDISTPLSLEANPLFVKSVRENLGNLESMFRNVWAENIERHDMSKSATFEKVVRTIMMVNKVQAAFKRPLVTKTMLQRVWFYYVLPRSREWLAESHGVSGITVTRAQIIALFLILYLLKVLFV